MPTGRRSARCASAPTKANVEEGEFAGVELTFMGLNNQNLHNFLFRGFLKPWEAYTGAKINWIDLAQADYNPRLQQSIATGTVDFDIIEMGAPFEGDTAGKGLLDEMPDWVKTQIDMDDYVNYLKAPVGTWDGKTYRITIDGDCHTFAYRKDYFDRRGDHRGDRHDRTRRRPGTQVQAFSKAVKGQKDPLTGLAAYGFLDPLKGWGGFGFYFLEDRASAYAKHPGRSGLAVRSGHHEAARQQPGLGAGDPGRDGPDRGRRLSAGPDQRRPRHDRRSSSSWPAPARCCCWWGDVGSNARTSDTSVVGDVVGFSINPGADKVYNSKTGAWEDAGHAELRAEHGLYRLGRLRHQPRLGRREEAQGGLVALRRISAARTSRCGRRPIRRASSPTATRTSTTTNGKRRATTAPSSRTTSARTPTATTTRTPPSSRASPASSSTTRSPRTNWRRAIAGQYKSAQETADAIAAAWEKITDQIGRDSQIKLYKASLGM